MTTQQQIFVNCRKMKYTWSVFMDDNYKPFTVTPVLVSSMANRCSCTEEEVIEAIKFFIDNGYDENDKEPFTLEFTNDYTGIIKKQSFAERMADDMWVSAWMQEKKNKGKFLYIFDKTYLTFKHFYEKSENN